MPEYRGIVNPAEVKATPVFDWNTVIQDVQKSVIDSEANRQASRDKLEKDTNDTLTSISKVTLGKDEAMNKKLTDAAYNFKGAVGDYAKLVREGKASQKDFNMFNQNAMDTFSQINAVGKNAKAAYDSYISESNAGNLSAASDYLAQTLGLAASLKDKDIIMDPKSGRGFIAGKTPGDVVDVNWLNNERNLLIPKVQLDKELDAQAKEIAAFTKVGRVGAGGIWTIDDATARKDFDLFENNVANGITNDPSKAMSVLTDYGDIGGKRYSVTINPDEAKADPSKILVKLNSSGNPDFVLTKEQDVAAKETAKRYLRERLKYVQAQVQDKEATWHGWAPDRSGVGSVGKPTEKIVFSKPAFIMETKGGKRQSVGQKIGVENVVIKPAPGVTERINSFGFKKDKNGKDVFFLDYTSYKGKESTTTEIDDSNKSTQSGSVEKKVRLYENLQGDELLAKLILMPNTDTGENFKDIEDARTYIRNNTQGGGFDPDAYFRQQTKKK
jgi:hypothetical protein